MSRTPLTTAQAIQTYVRAKDDNRPYLMPEVFAEDATLVMVVKTGSISFPPAARGLAAITDVLVRRFAQTYENVHTFCLASPPEDDATPFSCNWLVGMSEKESRAVRVGVGRYDWSFRSGTCRLVQQLGITVELMETLPPQHLTPVMAWLSRLPYPWCPARAVIRGAPPLSELGPVFDYLRLVVDG